MKKQMAVLLGCLLIAAPAWAVLGEPMQSVSVDQQRMRATRRTVTPNNSSSYTIEELAADNGTVVREFVTSAGIVFGVAWVGQQIPDLGALLGSYADAAQSASAARAHARTPVHVTSGNLVYESAGHMGHFQGRAYLTNMIPSDISAKVIQ